MSNKIKNLEKLINQGEKNKADSANRLTIFAINLFKFVTRFIVKLISLFHPAKRHQLPPIKDPILLISASELTKLIKSGEFKCETVIGTYIDRIKNVNSKINAVVDECFTEALKKAKEIDEQLKDPQLAEELKKKPLLGVPFTCKDCLPIKGLALTGGVKIREGIKSKEDATVIKNLKDAGAIPLCITNTPELVLWYDTENNLHGRTNNPYDLSRIAGGSSGGEGSLIASAGSLIGVGTDLGGSIRIPSMFNGTFGHKTTYKYVPIDGLYPPIQSQKLFTSFLCVGPICRYASDLSLMLKAMGGHLTNELRLDEPVDFRKLKIYYMEHDGGNPLSSPVDKRILNSMNKSLKYFREEYGIETEKINIEDFKFSLAFFAMAIAEVKIQEHISHDGYVNAYLELFKSFFGKSNFTKPTLIQILNQKSPLSDSESDSYKKFAKMLEELKLKVHNMLGDNAVLWMPTWPIIAPKHQTTILKGFDASYTAILNALEVAATHCPMGLTEEEGLPIGFTVAAAPGQDRLSIAFAKEIENVFGDAGWIPPN